MDKIGSIMDSANPPNSPVAEDEPGIVAGVSMPLSALPLGPDNTVLLVATTQIEQNGQAEPLDQC